MYYFCKSLLLILSFFPRKKYSLSSMNNFMVKSISVTNHYWNCALILTTFVCFYKTSTSILFWAHIWIRFLQFPYLYHLTFVIRAFLYKTASKLKKLKTNFEDKISFIIKISKCELINSASENENNGP